MPIQLKVRVTDRTLDVGDYVVAFEAGHEHWP